MYQRVEAYPRWGPRFSADLHPLATCPAIKVVMGHYFPRKGQRRLATTQTAMEQLLLVGKKTTSKTT